MPTNENLKQPSINPDALEKDQPEGGASKVNPGNYLQWTDINQIPDWWWNNQYLRHDDDWGQYGCATNWPRTKPSDLE